MPRELRPRTRSRSRDQYHPYKKPTNSHNTRKQTKDTKDYERAKKYYIEQSKDPTMNMDDSFIPKEKVYYKGKKLWNGQRSSAYPTSFSKETKAHFEDKLDESLPCYLCKKKNIKKQIDHITPLFKYIDQKADKTDTDTVDGTTWYGYSKETIHKLYNDLSNLQILCKSCNASKGGQMNNGGYEPSASQTKNVPYIEKPIKFE